MTSTRRLKYFYHVIDQRAGVDQPPLLTVSIHRGVIPRASITDDLPRAEDLSSYKICEKGDIVLNRMRAFQGAIGISPMRGLVSPDYMVLRPSSDVHARYLHHLFRSTWFVGKMTARLRGIGGTENGAVRTPRINPEDLGDIRVIVPSLEEQRRIADFLDAEVLRIDKLMQLDQAAREKLNERERAHRDLLVDRLLSGTGEISLRRFVRRIEQGASPQCESTARQSLNEWAVLKLSSIKHGVFDPSQNKRLPAEVAPEVHHEVRSGDLLITRANTPGLVGDAAVVIDTPVRLLLPDLIYRINLLSNVDPEFIAQVALGSRVRLLIETSARGSSQSMVKIRGEDIKEWPIPKASLSQQKIFVRDIRTQSEIIEGLRVRIDQRISLLRERRRALIAAAVTGQIDVTTARGV